jgi:SH3-like domain-containing protein
VVTAKSKDELIPLHEKPDAKSDVTAQLQPGVVSSVKRCSAGWCRVSGRGFDGWIPQVRLWGVYPNEKVD